MKRLCFIVLLLFFISSSVYSTDYIGALIIQTMDRCCLLAGASKDCSEAYLIVRMAKDEGIFRDQELKEIIANGCYSACVLCLSGRYKDYLSWREETMKEWGIK